MFAFPTGADLLDFEEAREPPSASTYFEDCSARQVATRRWTRRGGAEEHPSTSQAAGLARNEPEPVLSAGRSWMEVVKDNAAVEWLKAFMSKYRTLELPSPPHQAGFSSSARVRDLLFPEENVGESLQRFMSCLEKRWEETQGTEKAAAMPVQGLRDLPRPSSQPPEESRGISSVRTSQKKIRCRSAGGEDAPTEEIAAAVARARRRALEQRRRQAQTEEAEARAWRRERYGKRDERLARFILEEQKVKSAKPDARAAKKVRE
ncbi:REXO2 [Symbiodinium natans]|uniref:REXO2 protein n=1 Tax=Symbiodinium natans TaxID=878477 RepID=A0A812TRI9_9DINO|nr:REXO2 [Symbiodinium natans]